MQLNQLTQSLGIAAIYLGCSFALGSLLYNSFRHARSQPRALALVAAVLIFLPASVMMAGLTAWTFPLRLLVSVLGWTTVALAAVRPAWIPAWIWEHSFQRAYLAFAMALVTAWGLSAWMLYASSAAMMIGLAALTAGSSSARSMFAS